MKSIYSLILSSLMFANASASQLPETLHLTSHNLFPYGSFPKSKSINSIADDSFTGLAVDVVRCVSNKLGVNLVIHVLPWERAQKTVQHGKYDGFFAASKMATRDKFATMSAIIAEQKWSWFSIAGNSLEPDSAQFFEQAEVASFNGANMQKWLIANDYQVVASPKDTEKLLQMLLKGRLDAALANEKVMLALIDQIQPKQKINTSVLRNKPLGVYFSKTFLSEYPDFLEAFNSEVVNCRNTTD